MCVCVCLPGRMHLGMYVKAIMYNRDSYSSINYFKINYEIGESEAKRRHLTNDSRGIMEMCLEGKLTEGRETQEGEDHKVLYTSKVQTHLNSSGAT